MSRTRPEGLPITIAPPFAVEGSADTLGATTTVAAHRAESMPPQQKSYSSVLVLWLGRLWLATKLGTLSVHCVCPTCSM